MQKKGSIWWDNIGWAVIALAVLLIILAGVWVWQGKGVDLLEFLKNLFRFQR